MQVGLRAEGRSWVGMWRYHCERVGVCRCEDGVLWVRVRYVQLQNECLSAWG